MASMYLVTNRVTLVWCWRDILCHCWSRWSTYGSGHWDIISGLIFKCYAFGGESQTQFLINWWFLSWRLPTVSWVCERIFTWDEMKIFKINDKMHKFNLTLLVLDQNANNGKYGLVNLVFWVNMHLYWRSCDQISRNRLWIFTFYI